MNITKELSNILQRHSGGAFLFIGSGFSRRYLGLEDWEGLLTKFSTNQPFNYYKGLANKDLAKAAGLLANDFYELWWKDKKYENSRVMYQNYDMNNSTTPLRIEISNYLRNINLVNPHYQNEENLLQEIELLRSLNLDGIITTNWDLFLENLFPDYKVFIGQNELLFSNAFEIGEIYKIHGCASNPNSLVLTNEDYSNFEQRNAYLAAKLITIFMEHPIIFIGYSLNDKNIRAILQSIVQCLDDTNLCKLQNNLIFVQRLSGDETEQIAHHTISFHDNNISLPTTLIKTNNFEYIYQALQQTKKKLPVKLLRHFKEQFYELAYSSNTNEKISVVDLENIQNYQDIQVVVGIGIKEKLGISQIGYSSVEIHDIFEDILLDNKQYNPYQLLTLGFHKKFNNRKKYLPKFKWLKLLGINNQADYENWKNNNSNYSDLDILINVSISDLQSKDRNIQNSFQKQGLKTISDLINESENTPNFLNMSLSFFPFLDLTTINQNDLDKLRNFLIKHKDIYLKNVESAIYCTAFKKLIVLYDKLKYGW